MSSSLSLDAVTAVITPPRRVLVATRDAALGRMIAMALQLQGYSPHLYCDGQQALDALVAEPFTAAVLDNHLPTVNGLAVCERVRASTSTTSSVPIILLLLQEDAPLRQEQRQRLRLNAAVFIPFQLPDLLAAVAAAVDGKE
jgi:DNA-binding response OmpR family regulator